MQRLAAAPPAKIILPNEERFLEHLPKPIFQHLLQTLSLNHGLVCSQVPHFYDPCLQGYFYLPVFIFVLAGTKKYVRAQLALLSPVRQVKEYKELQQHANQVRFNQNSNLFKKISLKFGCVRIFREHLRKKVTFLLLELSHHVSERPMRFRIE
jgi:hypothetical protein